MDANPLRTARAYLKASPFATTAAILASVLTSIAVILLFPILFLFVDLLVWQGRIPAYRDLPPAQQEHFRDRWANGLGESEAVAGMLEQTLPTTVTPEGPLEWEARWQAANYVMLESRVGVAAAETYLPFRTVDRPPGAVVVPRQSPVGLLSTIVREQERWSGNTLAFVARHNPWLWNPDNGRPVNVITLTVLFVLAFVVLLLRGLLSNMAAYWAAGATIEAGTRMRKAINTHAARLSAVVIDPEAQSEAGTLISQRVEIIQDGLNAWLTQAFRWPVIVVAILAVLFVTNLWLTLGIIFLGLLVWLITGQVAAWFRQDARLAGRRADARLGLLRESLTMMPLVKGCLMERYAQTRLERTLSDLARSSWRKQRGDAISRQALLTVIGLVGLAMLFLAGLVVLGGGLSVSGLAVKAAGLTTLAVAVNRWIAANTRIARARAASAAVSEFLDRRGDTGQGIDAEFLQPMSRRLDFVGVSLRETGTGRMILDGVNLHIPAGGRTAIVYADAVEAQAIAHLIVRFLDPTGGEVKIDGKNIRWVTYESLRTQVGLVLENSLTFSDTVLTNISCGDPSFTLPQVIEAAKKVHAHQFVQSLPYGYETPVDGDGGVALTVGQRFRIALARAMLRDPSILIIEEPAEPMDPDSVALIDDAIVRMQTGRTLIFLARRPSTVKSADRVYVLQNGKVAASGHHEELLAGSELYRLLHFKQSLTTAESV